MAGKPTFGELSVNAADTMNDAMENYFREAFPLDTLGSKQKSR
jgi:hypothetical protein